MGLIIDNFAGGGGASVALEEALGRPVDIAINHDPDAISMHEANHPDTLHLQEDVFAIKPAELCAGRPIDVAWFSPDCKHFSRAKGGAPISTITGRGTQQQLVTSHLLKLRGTCKDGQPVTEPAPTITAGGLHVGEVRAFLLKYYGAGVGQSVNEPLHTVTTKERFGLVTIHGETFQIADIGMRMLAEHELYAAQGFLQVRPDYVIRPVINGKRMTKTASIARCGNSVSPPPAIELVRANAPMFSTLLGAGRNFTPPAPAYGGAS